MTKRNFSPFPELHTSRLHLRLLSQNDVDELFRLRCDERVNTFIDRKTPKDLEYISNWIEKINGFIKDNANLYWAITLKNSSKLIGTSCLWNFSEDGASVEIGYELHPDHWKKGLMRESLDAVVHYSFQTLGISYLEAYVNAKNEASTRLLESMGFIFRSIFTEKSKITEVEYQTKIYRLTSSDFEGTKYNS